MLGLAIPILALAFLVELCLESPADAKKPTLEDLAWMEGHWSSMRDGVETEEQWLAPKAGVMLGVNRTTRDQKNTGFEFLRIEQRGDSIVYLPQPQGKPVTEFPLKELKDKLVMFENTQIEFPQRVSYRLTEDGKLVARIEGKIRGESRAKEWVWEKKK